LDAWNAAVKAQRSLHACPGCARTFERPEARRKHVERCCPHELGALSDAESDGEGANDFERRGAASSMISRIRPGVRQHPSTRVDGAILRSTLYD